MLQTTHTPSRKFLLLMSIAPLLAIVTTGQDGPWKDALERGNQSRKRGWFPEAEKEYLEALRYASASGLADSFVAIAANNLGLIYQSEARYEDAERLYQKALAIW